MLGASKPLDFPNLIDFSAARGFNLYRLSLALANQRTGNGRRLSMRRGRSIRSQRLLGLPVDRRRRNRSGNWMSGLDPFYPSARGVSVL
jgi:hypothetical protein